MVRGGWWVTVVVPGMLMLIPGCDTGRPAAPGGLADSAPALDSAPPPADAPRPVDMAPADRTVPDLAPPPDAPWCPGCDDGKACTKDTCKGPGQCENEIKPGWCLIQGSCYQKGAKPPFG